MRTWAMRHHAQGRHVRAVQWAGLLGRGLARKLWLQGLAAGQQRM